MISVQIQDSRLTIVGIKYKREVVMFMCDAD